MPELDDRIERALRESARSPDVDPGVVARGVERKKVRRQARRNAATGALVAAVLVTTAVVTVAIVRRDDDGDRRVSTPPSTTAAQPADPVAAQTEIEQVLAPAYDVEQLELVGAREAIVNVAATGPQPVIFAGVRMVLIDGVWQMDAASACRVGDASGDECSRLSPDVRVSEGAAPLVGPSALAGEPTPVARVPVAYNPDYIRGPLVPAGDRTWASAYRRSEGGHDYPPSHVIRVAPDGAVEAGIDLEGEIQSFAEGEGARWAVTRDKDIDPDGTEFRVKRIVEDRLEVSMQVPPGEQPTGRVAVGGGSVWLPVLDGVLQFDAATGELVGKVALGSTQDRRGVAVIDGLVWVTNGSSLQRIETGGAVDPPLDTASASQLSDLVVTGDSVWVLASPGFETGQQAVELFRLDRALTMVDARIPFSEGLSNAVLQVADDTVLVIGSAYLNPLVAPSAGQVNVQPVATETVVVQAEGTSVVRTIVLAGANDAAVALEPSGDLLLTSGGDLYRADLP